MTEDTTNALKRFDPAEWFGEWFSFEQLIDSTDATLEQVWHEADAAATGPMAARGMRAFWSAVCPTTGPDNRTRISGWIITPCERYADDGFDLEWIAESGESFGRFHYRLVDSLERGLEGKQTLVFHADCPDDDLQTTPQHDTDSATSANQPTDTADTTDAADTAVITDAVRTVKTTTTANTLHAPVATDSVEAANTQDTTSAAHTTGTTDTATTPFAWLIAIEPMPPRTALRTGGLLSHLHFQYAADLNTLVDPDTGDLRNRRWYATMCDASGTLLDRCNIVRALHHLPLWDALPTHISAD